MKINNIRNCARCGGDHTELETQELSEPFAPPEAGGIVWTHWVPCPTNGEPILVATVDPRPTTDKLPEPVNGTDRFEEAIEWCYWRFDALRSGEAADRKKADLGPMEERDAFKAVLRAFYAKWRLGGASA